MADSDIEPSHRAPGDGAYSELMALGCLPWLRGSRPIPHSDSCTDGFESGLRVPRLLVLATAVAVCVPSLAQEAPAWPDTYVARLQALALLQTLNAEVLGSRSATLTLERWCRDHHLTEEPVVVARLVKGATKSPSAEQMQRLQVKVPAEVKYRRVQLRCGSRVLSEAENWYVPGRLTAEMNHLLETTDTPFGRVVQTLEPYRQTFAVKILWSPLPEGWERDGSRPAVEGGEVLSMPDALFAHKAVLYTRDHKPFSEVNEVYQRELLAFPAPR